MSEHRLRLLVVEDSADDTGLIARGLERSGYVLELSRVESAETLRWTLAENEYDLAITDHELSGFDSIDVLEILAELAPDLPCLLVSGKVGEEVVGQAMRRGAVDYIAKDNLGQLPMAVERTLVETERRRERHAAEEALARSGRLFEAVFVNAHDAMLILDDGRRLVDANPAAAALFATLRHELVRLRIEDLMPEVARADASRVWDEFLCAGEHRGEMEFEGPDGTPVATEYTLATHFLPGRHIVVMRDIRERRAAEVDANRRVAQQQALAALGERALRDKSFDVLMEAAVVTVATTLGVESASILELRMVDRTFVVQAKTGLGAMRAGARITHGAPTSSQASFTLSQDGPVMVEDYGEEPRFPRAPILGEQGIRSALSVRIPGNQHPFGVLGVASRRSRAFNADDASFLTAVARLLADALQRAQSEEEIRERSLYDSLTGLPNRTLFFDRLTLALGRTKRTSTRLAVLFLDIDHFKALNDTLGHRAGDRLLARVGERIARAMRDLDTVARFGGDEFVVLCQDIVDDAQAVALTARLASAFETPFAFEDERHKLTVSIGVALSDADNLDGEALLRDADIAMYHSKGNGRAMWTVATEEMRLAVIDRVETKRALENAVETNELCLHYQPLVALPSGELRGVEALVRWQHPQRGLISPGQFVPLAEESAVILRLGEWVLRDAAGQAVQWRAELGDDAPLPIHVNLSARQVADLDLPEVVRRIFAETRVTPGDIALEITETALIEGLSAPMEALAELRKLGASIVLDDFGTGYSSLSYLDRFPIDTLKIDRAFISQLEGPGAPAPIVTAIVGMARALGVDTVAEGVETAEQAATVALLGCNHAQGYFFARPGPAAETTALVRDDTPLRERAAEADALAPSLPATAVSPAVSA